MPGAIGFGNTGWGGPCPPSGEHRYEFRLVALSEPVGLDEPTADDVRSLAAAATGELRAVYARR